MIVFPAIDIKDNMCVRLTQGDFNKVKIYSKDPLSIALDWEKKGADFIHLVDLNGAKDEGFTNKETIKRIVKGVNLPIQIGGGIRDEGRIKELLEIGVNRVILGTLAVENKDLLKRLVREYRERIVVSIDAKNGKVATRGWTNLSETKALDLCKELEKIGVKTIVYTDILKDGMLLGPNFSIYEEILKETSLNLIASGGISSLEDIIRLKEIKTYGAIIGKGLYEKRLDFREVLICSQEESSLV